MFKKFLLFFALTIILASCSTFKSNENKEKEGEQIVKKKRINPNVEQRAREAAEKGGGIFNSGNKSTTYDFATSNVLWRATLESLEEIPLSVVDYSGGVVSTDWYSGNKSTNNKQKESIKITVRFLSDKLSVSSIKIISHKKICDQSNQCSTIKLNNDFNQKLKSGIMNKARVLNTNNEKKN